MNDDAPSTAEMSYGFGKQRIGYYKLWREKGRRRDWILISHFWKSDQGTDSETELPQQWALSLDRKGEPQWFGERGVKVMFTFRVSRSAALEVSREIYLQSWGAAERTAHKAGVMISLVLTT